MFTGGYITSTPTVGQLSRTGKVAVATATRDGYLFLTDTNGKASANDQWWHFHHDERNTGLYGLDTRPPATVDDLSVQAGASPGSATVSWTEVGDDWWVGQVPNGNIDLRWSTSPITDANFASATHVTPPATTAASGSHGAGDRDRPADDRPDDLLRRARDRRLRQHEPDRPRDADQGLPAPEGRNAAARAR